MEYVLIGEILNTFGIKGELKIRVFTDFVDERFKVGSKIYIGDDYKEFIVKNYRNHKGFLLIQLEAYEDINLVEKYKNMNIYKSKDDIKPLDDGYYFSDLKDLDVYVNDAFVGKVIRVEEGIRNNNLRVIKNEDKKEYLVPFIDHFILNVDLDNKRINIIDMAGLL